MTLRFLEDCLKEAARDAVPFGNIVTVAEVELGLDGEEAEAFVREVVTALLKRGVVVAEQADPASGHDWEINSRYAFTDVSQTVDRLMQDWKELDDGYGFFAWFTFKAHQPKPLPP